MNFTPDVTFGLQTNLKNRIRHLDINFLFLGFLGCQLDNS